MKAQIGFLLVSAILLAGAIQLNANASPLATSTYTRDDFRTCYEQTFGTELEVEDPDSPAEIGWVTEKLYELWCQGGEIEFRPEDTGAWLQEREFYISNPALPVTADDINYILAVVCELS